MCCQHSLGPAGPPVGRVQRSLLAGMSRARLSMRSLRFRWAIVPPSLSFPRGYRPALSKGGARAEPADAPLVEAAYLSMAALAGLDVPGHQVHALPKHRWALIVARFARVGDARRHVHTLAGLLGAGIR